MTRIYNTGETEDQLREEYNPEGSYLRRAQLRMLEMLKFLDKICKENELEYFIDSGTLLGAYRHGGFIPWDDDADVCMSCKDIRKLIKLINNGNYDYVIQYHKNDKGYVRHCYVLRDLKSEYIKNDFIHNQRKYRGLQVDIFPYGFGIIKGGKTLLHKLVWKNENQLLGKHPFLSSLEYNISHYVIIPFFKFLSIFKGKKTLAVSYEACWWHDEFKYDSVFPLSKIRFEDTELSCARIPEDYLISQYGPDYNCLPPKETRNHHSVDKIIYYD